MQIHRKFDKNIPNENVEQNRTSNVWKFPPTSAQVYFTDLKGQEKEMPAFEFKDCTMSVLEKNGKTFVYVPSLINVGLLLSYEKGGLSPINSSDFENFKNNCVNRSIKSLIIPVFQCSYSEINPSNIPLEYEGKIGGIEHIGDVKFLEKVAKDMTKIKDIQLVSFFGKGEVDDRELTLEITSSFFVAIIIAGEGKPYFAFSCAFTNGS